MSKKNSSDFSVSVRSSIQDDDGGILNVVVEHSSGVTIRNSTTHSLTCEIAALLADILKD